MTVSLHAVFGCRALIVAVDPALFKIYFCEKRSTYVLFSKAAW
jgi:hypothetical protein